MRASSLTLLPATQHGTANGNYDGTSTQFDGEPVKAAGYYTKDGNLQTISWHIVDLLGWVTIEATLDDDPESEDYFPIDPRTSLIGDLTTPATEDGTANVTGKYTWIRASVMNFTAGSMTKVSVGY